MTLANENKGFLPRPPIVAVMGHVDHGKTSLLDYIRKTNKAEREAGGITQSIGAYEIDVPHANQPKSASRKITFIDTPGHEAFSKMRARGATVADFAILVVAADESIKPQTRESIKILKDTSTPYVVAITKIDRNNADIERVKNDLMSEEVLLEGAGGNVSWQGVSVKTGEGVKELLETILLLSEVEALQYNPLAAARGFVLESHKDSRRGVVASVIIREGVLKEGDKIATYSASGQARFLENFLGKRAKSLAPSSPASIVGFETIPKAGEEFWVGEAEAGARADTSAKSHEEKETGRLKVVLKAEMSGSLEALKQLIEPMAQIVEMSVGDITAADVTHAVNTGSVIIAFGVKGDKATESLAQIRKVKIFSSDIIYELLKEVEAYIKHETSFQPVGELEVLKVFDNKAGKQMAGGKVVKGMARNGAKIEIVRGGEKVGMGTIANLQSKKNNAAEVIAGNECGMLIEADAKIMVGDTIKYF